MEKWKYGFWVVSILFVFHLIGASYYMRELKSRIVDLGRVAESTIEKWELCEEDRAFPLDDTLRGENKRLKNLNDHFYSVIKKDVFPALQIDLKLDDESIEGYELSDHEVTLAPQGTVVYKARIKVREKSFVDSESDADSTSAYYEDVVNRAKEAYFLDYGVSYPDTTKIVEKMVE